ncbi:MAG: hypothetical protein HYZ18_13965 [Pseudogulbenkiania sp.]|nr:hypothetical protein [Pseudogulbenkiania sp.]
MKKLSFLVGTFLVFSAANAGSSQYECSTKEWWQLSNNGVLEKVVPHPNSLAAKTFSKPFFVDRRTGAVLGSFPFWLQSNAKITVLNRGSPEQTFSAIYMGSPDYAFSSVIAIPAT